MAAFVPTACPCPANPGGAARGSTATPGELLDDLLETYLDALREAGDGTPRDRVVDSVTTTLAIRHGWVVDHGLALVADLSDEDVARHVAVLELIARLGLAMDH